MNNKRWNVFLFLFQISKTQMRICEKSEIIIIMYGIKVIKWDEEIIIIQ